MNGQIYASAALSPGSKPVPTEKEGGWIPGRTMRFGIAKHLLPLLGNEPRIVQPLAYLLCRLGNVSMLFTLQISWKAFYKWRYTNVATTAL